MNYFSDSIADLGNFYKGAARGRFRPRTVPTYSRAKLNISPISKGNHYNSNIDISQLKGTKQHKVTVPEVKTESPVNPQKSTTTANNNSNNNKIKQPEPAQQSTNKAPNIKQRIESAADGGFGLADLMKNKNVSDATKLGTYFFKNLAKYTYNLNIAPWTFLGKIPSALARWTRLNKIPYVGKLLDAPGGISRFADSTIGLPSSYAQRAAVRSAFPRAGKYLNGVDKIISTTSTIGGITIPAYVTANAYAPDWFLGDPNTKLGQGITAMSNGVLNLVGPKGVLRPFFLGNYLNTVSTPAQAAWHSVVDSNSDYDLKTLKQDIEDVRNYSKDPLIRFGGKLAGRLGLYGGKRHATALRKDRIGYLRKMQALGAPIEDEYINRVEQIEESIKRIKEILYPAQ